MRRARRRRGGGRRPRTTSPHRRRRRRRRAPIPLVVTSRATLCSARALTLLKISSWSSTATTDSTSIASRGRPGSLALSRALTRAARGLALSLALRPLAVLQPDAVEEARKSSTELDQASEPRVRGDVRRLGGGGPRGR